MNVIVWLILALIWGSTWIFIKIGLADLPPITFAAARFLLALCLLFPALKVLKIPLPSSREQWRLMIFTGILQFSVNYSTVFWAEVYISPGLAAVLQSMIPVFGLMLAWHYLPSERLTKIKIAAVLLGIAGVAVIFFDQLAVNNTMAFLACAAIVAGAYAAAHSSILIKAKAAGLHPVAILLSQMICGLPAILIYALIAEGDPRSHNWSTQAILCVVYLAVAGTIASFWLYYWLLGRIESTKAMMISLVTPLLALLIDRIFLGEQLPPMTSAGGILFLASIAMIVFRRRLRSKPVEA